MTQIGFPADLIHRNTPLRWVLYDADRQKAGYSMTRIRVLYDADRQKAGYSMTRISQGGYSMTRICSLALYSS
jgi:uncharacterized membrane protein YsdA (DUF1294 family)